MGRDGGLDRRRRCRAGLHASSSGAPFRSEVPQASERLPTRRLVLVGGGGPQNCSSSSAGGADPQSFSGVVQAAQRSVDDDHQRQVVVMEVDANHGRIPHPEADVAGVADPSNDEGMSDLVAGPLGPAGDTPGRTRHHGEPHQEHYLEDGVGHIG